MMRKQATPEKLNGPKMSRRLKALLIGSLALNLIVLGLVIGAFARHGGERAGGPPRSDVMIWALERSDRREIGKAVREAQGGGRKVFRQERRAAMQDVLAALRAEPFELSELQAAMARKGAHLNRVKSAAEAAFAERIAQMSDEERANYADRLEKIVTKNRGKQK